MADVETAPYDQPFDPGSAHGRAVGLVVQTAAPGLVLDLGCGYGPVAEPLREAGFDYIGVDTDTGGLRDLKNRGFTVGVLDLEQPADHLESIIRSHLGDRRVTAILALDVLEHLREPANCVAAITAVARDHADPSLVVSIPNVTHVDLVGKLLLGRWEVTTIGLLDRTHVQFFDARRAVDLLTSAGWRMTAVDDVKTEITEQCDPSDAPQLRPGSPLNDLLRDIRARSDGHGSTYQFVRAYSLAGRPAATARPAADAPFALVVVEADVAMDSVVADLAAQTERSFSVLLVGEGGGPLSSDLAAQIGIDEERVDVVADRDDLDASILRSGTRYVCVLRPGERVQASWLHEFKRGVDHAPGRVIVARCTDPSGEELPVATFDLGGAGLEGVVPGAAYAVPHSSVVAGAIRFGDAPEHVLAGLARAAAWSGRYDLAATTCSASDAADLSKVHKAVSDVLDEHPIVLAPGAASPLVTLHREFRAVSGELAHAREALEHMRHHYEHYVAASDAERAEIRRQLAKATTPWGALNLAARRGVGFLRRGARTRLSR